jgi:glycosyltransferase involved in cell wall biosynthesis
MLLTGLAELGEEIDVFVDGASSHDHPELGRVMEQHDNIEVLAEPNPWRWGRWYSKNRILAFASGLLARAMVHHRLGGLVLQRNARKPYDCVFQFSQTELFGLGRNRARLPPIVVHPCSHAAGELRWHQRESSYARASEGALSHAAARVILSVRARGQGPQLGRAAVVVGPSEQFLDQLQKDYHLRALRTSVLRHPVDLNRFRPDDHQIDPRGPVRLLYVSRISTRKGVEMIVGLSHRLADLANRVEIEVIGDKTLWSDYRRHLRELDPRIACYTGSRSPEEIPYVMRTADGLLMPSHYEPGSMVVSEALASGVPVVVSDAVGPCEVVDRECCRVFSAGNLDAFEAEVRSLLMDLQKDRHRLCVAARKAALQFAPDKVARQLQTILTEAATLSVW